MRMFFLFAVLFLGLTTSVVASEKSPYQPGEIVTLKKTLICDSAKQLLSVIREWEKSSKAADARLKELRDENPNSAPPCTVGTFELVIIQNVFATSAALNGGVERPMFIVEVRSFYSGNQYFIPSRVGVFENATHKEKRI